MYIGIFPIAFLLLVFLNALIESASFCSGCLNHKVIRMFPEQFGVHNKRLGLIGPNKPCKTPLQLYTELRAIHQAAVPAAKLPPPTHLRPLLKWTNLMEAGRWAARRWGDEGVWSVEGSALERSRSRSSAVGPLVGCRRWPIEAPVGSSIWASHIRMDRGISCTCGIRKKSVSHIQTFC